MATTIKTKVDIGKECKDTVTGLQGIAIAISKWQFGCIRIALQPPAKDGKVPDAVWCDEESIEGVKPTKESTGGPTSNPKHNPDPLRRTI